MFIKKDGTIFYFCSTKCQNNHKLGRVPRRVEWTAAGQKSTDEGVISRMDRTFVMVDPDGVQRGLVGEIVTRLEAKGLKLVAARFRGTAQGPG